MKKNGGCFLRSTLVGIGVTGVIAVLGLCLALVWLGQNQDHARALYAPPHVNVTSPADRSTFAAGSSLAISAVAFGQNPIVRAELWVDGVLKETEKNGPSGGVSPLYATFQLNVAEGQHRLWVRSVDTAGLIGQSLPVMFVGGPKPTTSPITVTVQPGQTWSDIAWTYSVDPDSLASANPSLGGQDLAAGMPVVVPISLPPEKSASSSADPLAVSTTDVMPSGPSLQPASAPTTIADFIGLVLNINPHPIASPTDLRGQVDNCTIRLSWLDNADNETRHDVWLAGDTGPRVIGTYQAAVGGPVWATLRAPQSGTLNLWVEAVNSLGRQPSNIVSLTVGPQCAPAATFLEIEMLDVNVSGGSDRVYCYASLQGSPLIRIPDDPQQFIGVTGGQAIPSDSTGMKLVVPVPPSGALDISGECWGWSGASLNRLGLFQRNLPANTWDGKRMDVVTTDFKLGVLVRAIGQHDEGGTRGAFSDPAPGDPSIPRPYDVRENKTASTDPLERKLTWKWGGDPSKISGFKIYLSGQPHATVAVVPGFPLVTEMIVRLPATCGKKIYWEVTAYTATGQSAKSELAHQLNSYEQFPCQAYVMVRFEKIDMQGDMCDWGSIKYRIMVNNISKSNSGGLTGSAQGAQDPTCGQHTFALYAEDRSDPFRDTIVAPIPDKNIKVMIGFLGQNSPGFAQPGELEFARVWYEWSSLPYAQAKLGCGIYASIPRNEMRDYTGILMGGSGLFGDVRMMGGLHSTISYFMAVVSPYDQSKSTGDCPPKLPYIPEGK